MFVNFIFNYSMQNKLQMLIMMNVLTYNNEFLKDQLYNKLYDCWLYFYAKTNADQSWAFI